LEAIGEQLPLHLPYAQWTPDQQAMLGWLEVLALIPTPILDQLMAEIEALMSHEGIGP
jgi:hypothetical protein